MADPKTPQAGEPTPTALSPSTPVRRSVGRSVATSGLLAVAALGALLFVALLATAAGGWWTLRTERGSAWLLSVVPGLEVDAPQGRLLGDFSAGRVVVHLPHGGGSVVLVHPAWRGFGIQRTASPLWARIAFDSIVVERIDLDLAPGKSTGGPAHPPTDLRLPVELEVGALRIGELRIGGSHIGESQAGPLATEPIRGLAARIHLGAEAGAIHRIDDLALAWNRLQLRGSLQVASSGPMPVAAALGIAQTATGPASSAGALSAWNAALSLAGPLAGPTLTAALRAEPSHDRPAQALDARATLHPFATWPLGTLEAHAKALDLSAFSSAAPATALDLQASASTSAIDRPARITVESRNALPGRWDTGRLPLRGFTLALEARPDQPGQVGIPSFDLELGDAKTMAGHLTGNARWGSNGWQVSADMKSLQPALLDARAPAMRLDGPVNAAGPASGGSGEPGPIDVRADLRGELTDRGTRRAVSLELDAGLRPRHIEVRRLRARAGGAEASASGLFTQADAEAPWLAKARLGLVDFDPALWWPGSADSPLRQAPTRLNATATLDLAVPVAAPAADSLFRRLAAIRGQAGLKLGNSLLAGVPASGTADWQSGAGDRAVTHLALDAGDNTVRADGRLNLRGSGADDDWHLVIDAATLDRLAPLYRLLVPAAPADATLAGTLRATAHLSGRWPALASQGELAATALQVGTLRLQQARADWNVGTSATAPVRASATVTDARMAPTSGSGPSLESLQFELAGTGRAHSLSVEARSRSRPPAWTDTVQPGAVPTSEAKTGKAMTVARLNAQGGIVDLPGAPLAGWRGALQQVDLRAEAPGAAPLLHLQNVGLELLWGGGPMQASLQPGRAELLGGALRWNRIAWQAAAASGATPRIEADVELEPLRIAPLLARAQPAFGWGGDLAVAGHVRLRSAPTFSADVLIERSQGDLSVTDELGTRSLGLTDLRLGLVAEHGTWNFTQGLAGRTLGVVAGAEVLQTTPEAVWPGAGAPLGGVLELRVADLGTWGAWVPAGWRLGGGLHTSATLGGRFGAPEVTGLIEGNALSVRNFLLGVNVSEGDVAIRLQGSTAHVERFVAHAGDGTLKIQGDADLGAAPRAALQVVADKFQLLGRVDRRIVASGTGALRLDPHTVAFDGKFGVDQGLIDFTRSDAPALSDDVVVRRAPDVPSPAAAASAAAAPEGADSGPVAATRRVALDLQVDLGRDLQIRGHGLDAKLRGGLHITSPDGKLAIDGTVRAEDGTYAAYGQKLAIDRGLITFNGAVENPRLDIEATRPDIDTRVGVIISGTPANLRVRLFSEPDMSDIDKLSWLVMGHASDGLGRNDTALLQRAALALFAGEGGGPTDQITKALGLDDISLSQRTEGDVTQTVLALGKQLTKRWYVGYERGLNATAGSFQLIYRIAQRFTLRMQSGDDTSVDLIWTWRWK